MNRTSSLARPLSTVVKKSARPRGPIAITLQKLEPRTPHPTPPSEDLSLINSKPSDLTHTQRRSVSSELTSIGNSLAKIGKNFLSAPRALNSLEELVEANRKLSESCTRLTTLSELTSAKFPTCELYLLIARKGPRGVLLSSCFKPLFSNLTIPIGDENIDALRRDRLLRACEELDAWGFIEQVHGGRAGGADEIRLSAEGRALLKDVLAMKGK